MLDGDIRVLFAEDSEDVIAIFRSSIDRLGWKGLYVGNAVEIIHTVNNMLSEGLELDAVVADLSFSQGPKLTAITAVRELRKAMPNVPVIFISPYVTSMIREEVRRVNGELIQAPFDMDQLFVRLSQLIYWSRVVLSNEYEGENKRHESINRSNNFRRATDYILSTPERIADILKGLKDKT